MEETHQSWYDLVHQKFASELSIENTKCQKSPGFVEQTDAKFVEFSAKVEKDQSNIVLPVPAELDQWFYVGRKADVDAGVFNRCKKPAQDGCCGGSC